MNHGKSNDELTRLVTALMGDTLSADQYRQLAQRLRDPDARKSYYEQVGMHAMLQWSQSAASEETPPQHSLSKPRAVPAAAPVNPSSRLPDAWTSGVRRLRDFLHQPLGISLAVALATLTGTLFVLSFVYAPLGGGDSQVAAPYQPPDEKPAVVGFIGRSHYADWAEASPARRRGTRLHEGERLQLTTAHVEITLQSGASLVLQGPAELILLARDRAILSSGELTATVPPAAVGLTIETPAVAVVDLGTEFGVSIDKNQSSLVSVFTGKVELQGGEESSRRRWTRRLRTGQSLRVDVNGKIGAARPKDDRFVRAGRLEQLIIGSPPSEHLTLWLDAARNVTKDENGAVSRWASRSATKDGSKLFAGQIAPRRRPVWIERAFGDRPALRFDGVNDFFDLPKPSQLGILDGDYEIFVVARSTSPKIQFLVASAMTSYELHLNTHEIGARFIPAAPYDRSRCSDAGRLGQFSDGRPHIFAAHVDPLQQYRGYVSVDGAATPAATMSDARSDSDVPLRIGRRADNAFPLTGEIAEVLFYDSALTPQQRSQVYEYLKRKYQLSMR